MENVNLENNKDNTKKRIILSSLIIVVSIVIIGLSLSYAYYINTVIETNADKQGASLTSGNLSMDFTTSQLINATSASLINDANVLDSSNNNYTAFSISFANDNTVSNASYNIYLTDIAMTENFKSSYVKWALYRADNTPIEEGDFSNVTLDGTGTGAHNASDITLASESISSNEGTKSYKLYIWLSNDPDNNQVSLLNGSLSAKVGFRATT